MLEENRFKLGLFFITGTILMVFFLFIFGLGNVFEKKIEVYTLFNESVQGLEVGSPVKYKGVSVGSVSQVKILPEYNYIYVKMDINDNSMHHTKSSSHNQNLLLGQVKKGLGCQLLLAGITGMKYINLDHSHDGSFYILNVPDLKKDNYIPARRSMIEDAITSLNKAITKIGSIDFEGISKDIKDMVHNMDELIRNPQLKKSAEALNETFLEIKKLAHQATKTVEDTNLPAISQKLQSTLASIEKTTLKVQKQVDDLEIDKIVADARELLNTSNKAVKNVTNDVNDSTKVLNDTLDTLNQNLKVILEVVESIEDDPSSIILGKSKPDAFKK